ncbi:MAG: acetate--CoA ligase [Candidatus Omnitrophica bacterium]|nr:acetate--CoA ligase [Candidatus Omnitrophota bacterium]
MPVELESLLMESRVFDSPQAFREHATIRDANIWKESDREFEDFWARWATELSWFRKWDRVLDWKAPNARWFVGGRLNASVNCLDRHLTTPRRTKAALIWEGEPGERRTLTYWDLYRQVLRFANALKALGVKRQDRVAIYLPMVPELVVAMLACARIGAVHSVVFAGFSAEALKDRIQDSSACLLITADASYRRGRLIPLKRFADEAVAQCPSIRRVVVFKRSGMEIEFSAKRDLWWHELMRETACECPPEEMDAEDTLYILYTSGTTGKPKGIVHTTGGYLTGVTATTQWVFDLKENDVYWCTADIGWVTGHSYVVYGPLACGATVVMYEGAPDWPDRGRFWKMVEEHGVSVFYTAPTAIRSFMKWGAEWPERHDLSSLRLLGTVGEPINPEAWVWYYKAIGREQCPIVDTWWQTETGMIMITPLPGITRMKPGSVTRPFPGIRAELLNVKGERVEEGGGYLAITRPWPAMLRSIYGDHDRYVKEYWSKWKGDIYFPGDGAKRDRDGDFWILGRVDDVLNVAGHRIGTMEVESALVDHPRVAEAAVVTRPHDVKGEAIVAFVTLKEGGEHNDHLSGEIREHVAKKIGAFARPEEVIFSHDLPKTRSGKIMRRLLRDIAAGKVLGDTTTLADPVVVAELKERYEAQYGA